MTNMGTILERRYRILARLAIATTVLSWASAFPLIGLALESMSALPLASARFAIVGMLAILLLPWLGEATRQIAVSQSPSVLCLIVLFLAILPGVVGYLAWTFALDHFGAARASNFLYLVPPTAMAIAFVVQGEIPIPSTVLGSVIAISGVVIVNVASRRSVRNVPGVR